MSNDDVVSWSTADRIQTVRLRRPPANALGLPLIEGLNRALDEFEASDARVLVIVSDLDGFFAAGADIKLMGNATEQDFADYGAQLRVPLDRLSRSDRPSIAAIEGLALGGGLELAMACTLRVGARGSKLGLPETKLGLIPGAGGTQRLPRLVGRGRALDIILTARDVSAEEAHQIGLLDRLVEPGTAEKEALALAQTLCSRSGAALTQVMRCMDDAQELSLDEGNAREAQRVTALFTGPEAQEGLQAFLQKRRPNYA
ncbi:enoyl-CoA hydratase/isomerase family protein [Pseudonocardia spinosispora]|uniref:enoyl-CoA hydratase/isomerase family protein n=1 Tax=Pseudonocardia spinosispora TaxID=103441 RepID=UPI00042A5463|nr:enoyl-CoA hydratase-related protein [Pseudonocardia spinosispora]